MYHLEQFYLSVLFTKGLLPFAVTRTVTGSMSRVGVQGHINDRETCAKCQASRGPTYWWPDLAPKNCSKGGKHQWIYKRHASVAGICCNFSVLRQHSYHPVI